MSRWWSSFVVVLPVAGITAAVFFVLYVFGIFPAADPRAGMNATAMALVLGMAVLNLAACIVLVIAVVQRKRWRGLGRIGGGLIYAAMVLFCSAVALSSQIPGVPAWRPAAGRFLAWIGAVFFAYSAFCEVTGRDRWPWRRREGGEQTA